MDSFESVSSGESKSYCFHLDASSNIDWSLSLCETTMSLVTIVRDVLLTIELNSKRKIISYRIGITQVAQKKNQAFNINDHRTFKVSGAYIGQRWNLYKTEEKEISGMVAIAAINLDRIPEDHRAVGNNQRDYALFLERSMQNCAKLRGSKKEEDKILHLHDSKGTKGSGAIPQTVTTGQIIYIVFQLEKDSEKKFER